jgi:hypothetical protein
MSGIPPNDPGIDTKQDELRKKGADFFEQFLEQARKGKDPLNEDPKTRRKGDVEAAPNEDLETVGRILPHILGALYFASTTAKLVVAKVFLFDLFMDVLLFRTITTSLSCSLGHRTACS